MAVSRRILDSFTHAARLSHQRMQPWCTRRENQLPASQHQSEELCRTPTHNLSVQFRERNRIYVMVPLHMLMGHTSRSNRNAGRFRDFSHEIGLSQLALLRHSEIAGTFSPRSRGNRYPVNSENAARCSSLSTAAISSLCRSMNSRIF